jgi:hypothetical protein
MTVPLCGAIGPVDRLKGGTPGALRAQGYGRTFAPRRRRRSGGHRDQRRDRSGTRRETKDQANHEGRGCEETGFRRCSTLTVTPAEAGIYVNQRVRAGGDGAGGAQ